MKEKAKIITGVVTLAASLLASAAFATTAHADQNVYRLYNPNTGEHFYTTSNAEKINLQYADWYYEGLGWVAPNTGTPVYRIYNPNAKGGDHYYTKSKGEAAAAVAQGWKWDNNGHAVFYSGGGIPAYVAYNPNAQSGAHNFTTNTTEQGNLMKSGWKYGTVAWNVMAQGHSDGMNLEQIAQGDT